MLPFVCSCSLFVLLLSVVYAVCLFLKLFVLAVCLFMLLSVCCCSLLLLVISLSVNKGDNTIYFNL